MRDIIVRSCFEEARKGRGVGNSRREAPDLSGGPEGREIIGEIRSLIKSGTIATELRKPH